MKKNIIKILTLLCSLVMTTSLLVACGGGSDADEGAAGAEIRVWCSTEDQTLTKELCKKFSESDSKYANYSFKVAACSEADAATTIAADAKKSVDVFAFASDQLNVLAQAGALATFNPVPGNENSLYARVTASHLAGAVDAATVSYPKDRAGTIETKGLMAFPMTSDNTYFMYYDKSVFTAEDVKTMEGIIAKCTTTQKLAFDMDNGWYLAGFYFSFDECNYKEYFNSNLETIARSVNFDNPQGVAATQAIYDLTTGYGAGTSYQKLLTSADDNSIKAGFSPSATADTKVVAAVSGSWNAKVIKESLGDNYGVAELPTVNYGSYGDKQMGAFAGYKLIGVNANSKNLAVAASLAEFLTNKDSQVTRYKARGVIPTNLEALKDDDVKADPIAKVIGDRTATCFRTQKNVPSTIWDALKGVGAQAISVITTGTGTFDAAEMTTAAQEQLQSTTVPTPEAYNWG